MKKRERNYLLQARQNLNSQYIDEPAVKRTSSTELYHPTELFPEDLEEVYENETLFELSDRLNSVVIPPWKSPVPRQYRNLFEQRFSDRQIRHSMME